MLPDVIRPGLHVVFCGTAAGTASARAGAYYAGPGNQFWPVLHRIGLTPDLLAPAEYERVLDYGLGLTDLCKTAAGSDRAFANRPSIVAFSGKTAASAALGRASGYGRQEDEFAGATVYVLPSTSGAARGYWQECYWHDLAAACIT